MKQRTIILIITLAAIIGAIAYLEAKAPAPAPTSDDIILRENLTTNTSMLTMTDQERIAHKAKTYERAKELVSPDGYINTPDNLTLSSLIGKKVILLDFWTYSCINCQRTLPYLESWYTKYEDQGLVIIGVHTPEFDFEKNYDNVLAAVKQWNITYPVVQDNERQTWQAYNNRYWPRKYLIDIDGFIVYDHIGEGGYQETEQEIQRALKERTQVLGLDERINNSIMAMTPTGVARGTTPEIYFGYAYARNQLGNPDGWHPGQTISYALPTTLAQDQFYLQGEWHNNKDNMQLTSTTGLIVLNYYAKEVNLVAAADDAANITISIDGKKTNTLTIQPAKLYHLYSADKAGKHDLIINASTGLQVYTFTFG